jgi:hypothetical protein
MSGLELVAAFLAGVVMGGALDHFVLPLLVDACIDRPGCSTHGATRLNADCASRLCSFGRVSRIVPVANRGPAQVQAEAPAFAHRHGAIGRG